MAHKKYEQSREDATFLTIFGTYSDISQFKHGCRLEFSQDDFNKQLALLDAGNKASGAFNRGGMAGLLSLRTLFAIHQQLKEPSYWKMHSLVLSA